MRRVLRLFGIAAIAAAIGAVPASASLGSAGHLPSRNASAQYTLKVVERGLGYGNVTSSPAGIGPDCWHGCSAVFPAGTQVTLTLTPASGFIVGYTLGCSGRAHDQCTVTMSGDKQVTVDFTSSSPLPPPPPPKLCIVPNIKGKTLAAARKTISRNHCTLGEITRAKSAPKNRGRVISEKPKAGTHLKSGGKVALKVGK